MGFFLAVLLGAVFSSFNSLLNSAATLFCIDVYTPMRGGNVSDKEIVRVAMIASVVIAIFSFIVAPLLFFAPEGLWQVIRVFTGFYNIPIVTIVIVGLFTRRTPAIGAKIVIVFHVVAYGLAKFVFDEIITIHFLHLYAILFVIEVAIMLVAAKLSPRQEAWSFEPRQQVDLSPWRLAPPVATTLLSLVVAMYLVFSPLGLAGAGPGWPFAAGIACLVVLNVAVWASALLPRRQARP